MLAFKLVCLEECLLQVGRREIVVMSHSTHKTILGHLLVLIEMLIVLEALHVTPATKQRASLVGLLGPASQQEARVLLARL